MAPSRRAPALLGLGAFTLIALVAIVLALTPASAESVDIYEFEILDANHGAEAVAVRADGSEAVVLTSEYNDTTRLYVNYVFSTTGTSLTERVKWINQTWKWTCAAFDPGDSMALLAGTQGKLSRYDGGTVTNITSGIPYDILCMDWHPTDHEAYMGTTTSRIYKYRSGSISIETYTYSRVMDLDVRPDGGEIVISSYYYVQLYNLTRGSMVDLIKPMDDTREYYYCYAVEYNNNGNHFLASWYNFNSYTIFRYVNDKWLKVSSTANAVDRIRFENEGTFALMGMSNNLQYIAGATIAPVSDWYSIGDSGVNDLDYNENGFYFLMGTEAKVLKFKRQDNVKPGMDRPIPDVTFDEDDVEGGDNLIDLLNYVKDDRHFSKLRFEFDYQQDEGLVRGEVDGHYLDFSQIIEHWNGKMAFRLKIWDQGADDIEGNFDDEFNRTNMFNVTVRPINDPVTFVTLGERIVTEEPMVFFVDEAEVLNLTIVTHDVDNDPYEDQPPKFTFNWSLPSIKVDHGEMILSLVPRNVDVGSIYIKLMVNDGFGSMDSVDLVFHVKNVNNPPKLLGIRDRTVLEDEWLNFTVTARDEDLEIGVPDVTTFSTNVTDGSGDDDLPNFQFIIDPEDATRILVSFLPVNENVGVILVEFRVQDGGGFATGTWQDTRTMRITVVNTNDAPVLVEMSGVNLEGVEEYSLVATEDTGRTLDFKAHDDDSDLLFFYVDDSRFELRQPGGGNSASVTFTPTNDDVGTIFVTLSVWDMFNTFDQLRLNITVVNINDPPKLIKFESKDLSDVEGLEFTLYEDVLFTAPVVITDIDSDFVTFSDSEGLFSFDIDPADPHRAIANLTPRQSIVGVIITTLEVDDGDGDTDAITLTLTIIGTNDPPGKTEISQLDISSLTIPMKATRVNDPEGDELTYTWDFGDHGPTDSGVDLTQVEHTYARPGTYIVTVTITDGRGGVSESTADIIVPDLGEEPQETDVQEGPVGMVAVLVAVFAAVVIVFLYLLWRMPTRNED